MRYRLYRENFYVRSTLFKLLGSRLLIGRSVEIPPFNKTKKKRMLEGTCTCNVYIPNSDDSTATSFWISFCRPYKIDNVNEMNVPYSTETPGPNLETISDNKSGSIVV